MSQAAFEVRRASAEDAAELARVAELTFTESFGHLYPPEDLASHVERTCTPPAWRNVLSDAGMACWAAGAAGQPIVGFAVAGHCKLPVERLEPAAGELRQLYVESAFQNRRLGTRLFEAALEWLERHYSPLYIGVWSRNYGAQRFYGRYGFVKVGDYEFPVGKTIDHELILKRWSARETVDAARAPGRG